MQFLPRRSYNFKIARVNRLRFQPDFSAIIAATSQEFRTCSKLDKILRRFLTILNHKGRPREVLLRRVSVSFCMVMANTDKKKLHSSLSSSSPSTGNSISPIHKQAAAKVKSSSIFMLIYRYIFRVVSKSKPKKSKLTNK